MIGTLLVSLEEIYGEKFVTQCFIHYANETDKMIKLDDKLGVISFLKGKGANLDKKVNEK